MAIKGIRVPPHSSSPPMTSTPWSPGYGDVLGFVKEWEDVVEGPEFDALIGIEGGTVPLRRRSTSKAQMHPVQPHQLELDSP